MWPFWNLHHCACDEACEAGFFSHRSVAALTMLDWLLQDQTYRHVLTAVDFVGDQYRQLADVFLMDSLVAEYTFEGMPTGSQLISHRAFWSCCGCGVIVPGVPG